MAEFRCEKCDREFGSKEALDMHNKSKHSESYKEPRFSNKQKKKIRNYAILFVIILLIGGFIYWRLIPPKNAPIISIEPSSHNFGLVSQAEGVVSATLQIKNIGNEVLVLKNMDTSCGCTSASIISDGQESPRFSMAMHGTNPKNWKQVIPPGKSVDLKVYYDPNVHRDMRGPVRRSVSIYSNDPRNKVKEVIINANQVD